MLEGVRRAPCRILIKAEVTLEIGKHSLLCAQAIEVASKLEEVIK